MSCWELRWLNRYVQTPDKPVIIVWTFIALSLNIIYVFMVFFECAFRMTAIEERRSIDYVMVIGLVIEIIMIFFVAYPETDSPRGLICILLSFCGVCKTRCRKKEELLEVGKLENNTYETDFKLVASRYITGFFVVDFLSVVPYMIVFLASPDENFIYLISRDYMTFFAYLRLLRITQIPRILNASSKYAQIFMNKFPSKRQIIWNSKQIFSIVLFLLLALHLSACLNIFQGMGKGGWIDKDEHGKMVVGTPFELYIT